MEREFNRRRFLGSAIALGGNGGAWPPARLMGQSVAKTSQPEAEGYFTLGQRKGHWWLITPEGEPFFSLGLNHIDPASMRYPENLSIWRETYKGNMRKWLRESVARNLKRWGFNTVGWVQEVTVRHWRHSRPFTKEEYRALGMPYCHLLPFTESHQWESHVRHYDFRSSAWEEWCDYVARADCADMSEERNLIGYFYCDCPTWVHTTAVNRWRGPIFDPDRLKTEAGRKELSALACKYYQTTHDAIRRYDRHHLILGDRYEANAALPDEVVHAALPYVDVLSFQDFRDPVTHLAEWHNKTRRPVLLADAARGKPPAEPDGFVRNDGQWYAETVAELFRNPGCIGFHLCGAYQRNRARRRGLVDEGERPDQENVELMKAANERIIRWMDEQFR